MQLSWHWWLLVPGEQWRQQMQQQLCTASHAIAHTLPPATKPPLRSSEHRANISAGRRAMLERLGGWPEEWAAAMSRAATGRKKGLAERHRISEGHRGKQCR